MVTRKTTYRKNYLVGGDWNHGMDYDFPFSWECHHPTDFHVFRRGRAQPPTSYGDDWGILGDGARHGACSLPACFSDLCPTDIFLLTQRQQTMRLYVARVQIRFWKLTWHINWSTGLIAQWGRVCSPCTPVAVGIVANRSSECVPGVCHMLRRLCIISHYRFKSLDSNHTTVSYSLLQYLYLQDGISKVSIGQLHMMGM